MVLIVRKAKIRSSKILVDEFCLPLSNFLSLLLTEKKNGFGTATKLGTTNEIFVAATKNFAAATKRFADRT